MSTRKISGSDPELRIAALGDKDGMVRRDARKSLVALGKPAVAPLSRLLRHAASDRVRWEAAKALGEISDAGSIPALVRALEDENADVAWLAAAALRRFRERAWPELLRALMKAGPDSFQLRRGAHHVLWNRKPKKFADLLAPLLEALESGAVHEAAALAAHQLLERITIHPIAKR